MLVQLCGVLSPGVANSMEPELILRNIIYKWLQEAKICTCLKRWWFSGHTATFCSRGQVFELHRSQFLFDLPYYTVGMNRPIYIYEVPIYVYAYILYICCWVRQSALCEQAVNGGKRPNWELQRPSENHHHRDARTSRRWPDCWRSPHYIRGAKYPAFPATRIFHKSKTRQVEDIVNGIFCAAHSTASPSITIFFLFALLVGRASERVSTAMLCPQIPKLR